MTRTILLIEDDIALRDAIEQHLGDAGYTVIAQADSISAIEDLDRRRVDLVVADILLGNGRPHGIAFASMAKWRLPNIPIVLLTGHPEYLDLADGVANKVMLKPVRISDLLEEIQVLLAV
jgi:CheY-like chemotaxis protein